MKIAAILLAFSLCAAPARAGKLPYCMQEIADLTHLPAGTEVDSNGTECFEPARTLCACFEAHYWTRKERQDPKIHEDCLMSQAIGCHGANIVRMFGKKP